MNHSNSTTTIFKGIAQRLLFCALSLLVTFSAQAYTSFTLGAKSACEIASGTYRRSGNGYTANAATPGVIYCEVEVRTPLGGGYNYERYIQVQVQIERHQPSSRTLCWVTGTNRADDGVTSRRTQRQSSTGNTSIEWAYLDTRVVDMVTLGCFIDSNDTIQGYRLTQS